MNIYFDKTLKRQFLEAQKLTVDPNGYLVDATTGKRVNDESKQPIKAKSFGGIRKGSRVFLNKDIETVIREASLDKA
jgi:hypothetical protein